MEQSGKALHSGKNAEKRRSEAIKRELLVLVHDFLTEEGLFEGTYLVFRYVVYVHYRLSIPKLSRSSHHLKLFGRKQILFKQD